MILYDFDDIHFLVIRNLEIHNPIFARALSSQINLTVYNRALPAFRGMFVALLKGNLLDNTSEAPPQTDELV